MSAQAVEAPATYEAYGCRINAFDPATLMQRYAEAGFLYPAKREQLAPFLPEIVDNWRRAVRGGELIHVTTTCERAREGGWAAVTSWRSTHRGWQTQHLVSIGGPRGSRAVMLAGQAVRMRDGFDHAHQSWFRPENRFPNRVFGSIEQGLGKERAAVIPQALLAIPTAAGGALASEVPVSRQTDLDRHVFERLAVAARGRVYVAAEELDRDDLELEAVDELYSQVGLRRYRRIWLAWEGDRPVGAAIAWRGPLGFNFSFLENRCDLLLEPGLAPDRAEAVVRALLRAASQAYGDFRLGQIPVVIRDTEAAYAVAAGAQLVRNYTQSIWLQDGFETMYAHMARFYTRIERIEARRGLAGGRHTAAHGEGAHDG